jgi:hypothetical protein
MKGTIVIADVQSSINAFVKPPDYGALEPPFDKGSLTSENGIRVHEKRDSIASGPVSYAPIRPVSVAEQLNNIRLVSVQRRANGWIINLPEP